VVSEVAFLGFEGVRFDFDGVGGVGGGLFFGLSGGDSLWFLVFESLYEGESHWVLSLNVIIVGIKVIK
jgi:hypothetical protein